MIHTSIAMIKPGKGPDGKFVTQEFVPAMKHLIFQELFGIKQEFGQKFGELVICLDMSKQGYWRKDVYPGYKLSRKKTRDASDVDFSEVFKEVDGIYGQLRDNLPWKVVEVPRAEADDVILVLARELHTQEKILIHSPDQDMMQAQRDPGVQQYSSLTKRWIAPTDKHDSMEHWMMEHVCLGDLSDGIPKIVDGCEFSPAFLAYLRREGYNIKDPVEFKSASIPREEKLQILQDFDVFKLNRKGESTGVKDVYRDTKFGPAALKKKLAEFGTLDEWLDSHPLYRQHYTRNHTLIMAEGIPRDTWMDVLLSHKEAPAVYRDREFEQYLTDAGLGQLIIDLPTVFRLQRELNASDFNW